MTNIKQMPNTVINCQLLYVSESQVDQIDSLQALIANHALPIVLNTELMIEKLNQKRRQQLSLSATQPILLLDDKNKLSWLSDGLSVTPEWDKLQRRVVSAGRKSELLLQAAKLTADSTVIDATAGFGHDSLILASTGAQVIMLEQQPILALLLLAERQKMAQEKNWQKLMARLSIVCMDASEYLASKNMTQQVDVVYLDPMFPDDSYENSQTGKGAKVGKHMQALHGLVAPPDLQAQQQLLDNTLARVKDGGRVVVKRPVNAPNFAERTPDEIWQNNVIRFDGYFV